MYILRKIKLVVGMELTVVWWWGGVFTVKILLLLLLRIAVRVEWW